MTVWITAAQLGGIASISDRKARAALARAASGKTWRGVLLRVEPIHDRGGASGRYFRVAVNSLPTDLQAHFQALRTPVQLTLKLDNATSAERNWWTAVLAPASCHPTRSKERAAAVRTIVAAEHIRDGKRVRVPERTVLRKLAALDAHGLAGLTRKKRAGAGERAVILSQAWDKAVPFDDRQKERIAHELRQHVRSLLKGGEATTLLRMEAALHLIKLTREAGFDPGADVLAAACAIPVGLVRAERHFRKVHTFKTDRKAHEDRRPRIRRHRDGLMPNVAWVPDVHPVDVPCRRASDGSVAYPKAIAWLDIGTNRFRADYVLCEPGKGIAARDVIRSLLRTTAVWGGPRGLYTDNGSEYNWTTFIEDALKLMDGHGCRIIGDIAPWETRKSNIVNAKAYHAQSKPIENIFRVLENNYWITIPGKQRGDRQKPKTANHGKAIEPFPGTFEQLCELLDMGVATYNAMPQKGGALKGKSPNQALQDAIDAGWGMTAVDPDAFRLAFAEEQTRTWRQGAIEAGGQRWTSPTLQAYQGDTVTVLLPKFERPSEWTRLAIRGEDRQPLGFVEVAREYGIFDPAGAVAAGEMESIHRRGVMALDRSAPTINMIGVRSELAKSLQPEPTPPVHAKIEASDEAKALGNAANETPAESKIRISAERAKKMRQDEIENARHTEAAKKYVKYIPGKK